ncbi:hypothetical protein PRK78_004614 [Emydomyces testavorans]|uniref:HNH nuclease domain-containing protein n=1 Tax=Emydomyces testavorans TaxID=2070801 RepID=A0AAF0DIB5_9EURO|nr:hypothetical protein PRK78_004614 [Emydomyces testavorans]
MASKRSRSRNVWIMFASDPGNIQGGLCAANNLTQAQFLDMLTVAFTASGGFHVYGYHSAVPLAATSQILERGSYTLSPITPGEEIHRSNERYYPRTLSVSTEPRDVLFRDQVRNRDRRCVITGQVNYEAVDDRWVGFEAAHIFPLALAQVFDNQGFANLITHSHPLEVNSPQNGLLLSPTIHRLWDDYSIAVNPYDGYRVQAFRPNAWEYHNNVLHPVCRQPGHLHQVIDALLRWHFEQAVLCNMRGAGEVSFEFDFPPGTDMMGEIRQGPLAVQRMEAQLFSRLYGFEGAGSGTEEDCPSHTPED